MPVQQMHDPDATDMYSGDPQWSPELAYSVPMGKPDNDFCQSAQSVGESSNFRSQPPIGFQAGRAGYSYPNTAEPWYTNAALIDPQWQDDHHIFQGLASFFDIDIPSENAMGSQFPHFEVSHPQTEETQIYHGQTGQGRSDLGHTHEMTMEPNSWDQGMRQIDQRQDSNHWALPILNGPVIQPLSPVPALIYLEPRTDCWQPPVEAVAVSKPRKRRSVKLGSNRRAGPGPKVLIFKSKDMKQVNKRPRFQTDEQKRRTVFVRKHGACPDCNRAHRACTHIPEEASSPAPQDPTTPNADVPMNISIY